MVKEKICFDMRKKRGNDNNLLQMMPDKNKVIGAWPMTQAY